MYILRILYISTYKLIKVVSNIIATMTEKKSVEELIKLRDSLKKDLEDLQKELNIVKAAVENPKQTKFIKQLQDQKQLPNVVKQMLEPKAKKIKLIPNERAKLLKYYQLFTEIFIDKSTVEFISTEDTEDKCYLYKVEGILKYLKFSLSYHSNKASYESKENEVISKLQMSIEENPLLQKEIQEGLDFYYNHPSNIQQAMLFLKDAVELNLVREKILKRVVPQFERHLTGAVSNESGRVLLKFQGNNNKKLCLGWRIKFNPSTYLAMDAIELQTNLKTKKLDKFIKQITDHNQWTSYDIDKKVSKIQYVVDEFLTDKALTVDTELNWDIS